ncbi:MAG: extracellular solute-binding protein [Clostridia bacterium]|nr:extracellular solute-binding protein [Clostridia bacterium]
MSAKKLFALALALLMVISMVACGDKPSETTPATTPDTTPATTPDSYHAKYGLPDVDFSGKTLEIVDSQGWAVDASLEGNHTQVARFEMLSAFQNETGAELIITPAAYSTMYTDAQSIIMSGDKYGDIQVNAAWTLGNFYMSDLLLPMDDIKYLDLSKDYWNKSFLRSMTVMDKLWAVGGEIASVSEITWMMFYNKSVAEELQLPDLYQMVRDGEWTFDKFIEYCEMAMKDNGDNVWTAEDRYGVGSAPATLEQALYYSMGGNFYNINEQGKYYCSTMDERNRTVIDLILRDVRDNFISYDLSGGEEWTVNITEMFPTGRLLFACYVPMHAANAWAEMVGDYGVLPLPKLNKDQANYQCSGEQAIITFFICRNADQLDMSGYFLEFCAAFGNDVLKKSTRTHFETSFRDEDSLEMFDLATNNPYFELVTLMLANTSENGILFAPAQLAFNNTVATPGASIASAYESYIEAVNLKIDELFGY